MSTKARLALIGMALGLFLSAPWSVGEVLQVPASFRNIQAAIVAAGPGDTVLVGAGTYHERLTLKPGVGVKSAGDDAKGEVGLLRAEVTILDLQGGEGTGVEMAEGAVLDGFTVTGAGKYDDGVWQHDFDTQGNEQAHEPIGQPGKPGIGVKENCTVVNNIVHHNGYTGIVITGAEGATVSPLIARNVCHRNMGGGIGSMEGSTARIEGNVCFENLDAGIGHEGSSPIVRDNVCHHNVRAGIGISEGSSPTVTGNRCYQNQRAGIGIRTGATTQPLVENNECSDNAMAGIGVEEGARPRIVGNRLLNNKLVAIGVTGGSEAIIEGNELDRDGGVPPMIAVLEGCRASITDNTLCGGGVAGILVKGSAEIRGNHLIGTMERAKGATNSAVWVHPGAEVIFKANRVDDWPRALLARRAAKVVAMDNEVSGFRGVAIVVEDSEEAAEVSGNVVFSDESDAQAVDVSGPALELTGNEVRRL